MTMVSSEYCDVSPGHNETIKTMSGDERWGVARERSFAFCWVSVQQTEEGERTGLFLLLSSESAANNPSLVFVINSKSLIYIFQLLDVWIALRSEGSKRRASLGPGQHQIRGGSQEPFEIPSTDSPQPAMPPSQHNCLVSLTLNA